MRTEAFGWRRFGLLGVCLLFAACGEEVQPETFMTIEQLMDPETCKECHADHYREWSGSMHAYASEDPVFLAMNARGQRETNGELGDFCVGCHAPMAVRTGATTDGLNLAEVPQHLQGITCYFCHNVTAVEGTHNNPLTLANDGIMRGGIKNPVKNTAHSSAYSALMDREELASADVCGSCHDIVNGAGVELERTYKEWQDTLFSNEAVEERLTCGGCHMDGRDDLAADAPGVFLRRVHSHAMPGVDLAITPFPEKEVQRNLVQRSLDTTLLARMCVEERDEGVVVEVELVNVAAGHAFPSGATQDRRAWVELIATTGAEVTFSSGVVEDDQPLISLDDPQLWEFRDKIFDAEGNEVHMFWEAVSNESTLIPGPEKDHAPGEEEAHATHEYTLTALPDEIKMRVRIRPLALDFIDDLIESGDLDPRFRDEIVTMNLAATELTWTPEAEGGCVP